MILATLLIPAGILSSAVVGYVVNYIYWSRKSEVLTLTSEIMTFLLLIAGALPVVVMSCFVDGYDTLSFACFGSALFGGFHGAWRALPKPQSSAPPPQDLSFSKIE